jgi:hypothetical protein
MNFELWQNMMQGTDLGMLPTMKKFFESTNNN